MTPRRRQKGKGPEAGTPRTPLLALPMPEAPYTPQPSPGNTTEPASAAPVLRTPEERCAAAERPLGTTPRSGSTNRYDDDTATDVTDLYEELQQMADVVNEVNQSHPLATPSAVGEAPTSPMPVEEPRSAAASDGTIPAATPQRSCSAPPTSASRRRSKAGNRRSSSAFTRRPKPRVTPGGSSSRRGADSRRKYGKPALPPLPAPPNTGTVYNLSGQTPKTQSRRLSSMTASALLKARQAREGQAEGCHFDAACKALWTGHKATEPKQKRTAPVVPSLQELLMAKTEDEVVICVDENDAGRNLGGGRLRGVTKGEMLGSPSSNQDGPQWARPVTAGPDPTGAVSAASTPGVAVGVSAAARAPVATELASSASTHARSDVAPTMELYRQRRIPSAPAPATMQAHYGEEYAASQVAAAVYSDHRVGRRHSKPGRRPRAAAGSLAGMAPLPTEAAGVVGAGQAPGPAVLAGPNPARAFSELPRQTGNMVTGVTPIMAGSGATIAQGLASGQVVHGGVVAGQAFVRSKQAAELSPQTPQWLRSQGFVQRSGAAAAATAAAAALFGSWDLSVYKFQDFTFCNQHINSQQVCTQHA